MAAAAPAWRPDAPNMQLRETQQRVWRGIGNQKLIVTFSIAATDDEAATVFRAQLLKISVGGLMPLQGVGDEAYLLSKYTPSGVSNIYLRNGRVMLEISGTDEDMVKQAAREVVHELDAATAR